LAVAGVKGAAEARAKARAGGLARARDAAGVDEADLPAGEDTRALRENPWGTAARHGAAL
jgi:hypothetical protein